MTLHAGLCTSAYLRRRKLARSRSTAPGAATMLFRDSLFPYSAFVFVTFLLFYFTLLTAFPDEIAGCWYMVTCVDTTPASPACCRGARLTLGADCVTHASGMCPTSASSRVFRIWCYGWILGTGATSVCPSPSKPSTLPKPRGLDAAPALHL